MPQHTAPRIIYRYATGRQLNGQPRTDGGSYLRPGRGIPGWKRQAWRLGVPAAAVSAVVAEQAAPVATITGGAIAAVVGTVAGGRNLRRRWRMRRFNRTYIGPTVAALRTALGDAPVKLRVDSELGNLVGRLAKPMAPAEVAVRAWYGEHVEPAVRWAPDQLMRAVWALRSTCQPVTVHLDKLRRPRPENAGPRIRLEASVPYVAADQKAQVSSMVAAKIPAGDLNDPVWDQVGERVTATWTVRRRPPTSVGYADLDARFAQLKEWEFFIGLGVGGKPVVISFQDDSPHIALSAGTGAGKSVLAQLVALQVLARGGRVTILDIKGSHRWAIGMPGVDYCTTPAQMHAALLRLADLADQRNTDAFHEEEGWDPGPRHLVICEEMNATTSRLKDYWEDVREPGQPKTSPGIKALRSLLFMGRSAKVHVLAVAQMLTALATGGPEGRENFGVRCLARYTVNAWKMLVPEASMPRASRTLGRWQIVTGGVAHECQVAYLGPAEARLFVAKMSPAGPRPGDNPWPTSIKGERAGGDTPADPLSERVTLRDAVDRGLTAWKYDAAKKRLQRARARGDAAAPAPVGKAGQADLYRIGDLIVWIEAELRIAATPTEAGQ
jgi:hypothetical protein